MSDRIWVRSKWKSEDLHSSTIEFRLPIQDGEVEGVGQLIVEDGADGLLSIDIRTVLRGETAAEQGTFNFHVNQWAADQIERHSDPSRAEFSCIPDRK
jgi:hypothetical protein